MCHKWISFAACTVAIVAGSALMLRADDKSKPAGDKPAAGNAMGQADMAKMMEAWQKYATPGPEHAELAKDVGEWKTLMEDFSMGPQGEKSEGSSKVTMIMGGRYLMEEVKATTMGMPMEGLMLLGYDNQMKRYDSIWIDNMGTAIMSSHGTKTGDKMELAGDMTCPLQDTPMHVRSVTTMQGPDKRVMEMYMPGPDGKEMMGFRVTYTRVK